MEEGPRMTEPTLNPADFQAPPQIDTMQKIFREFLAIVRERLIEPDEPENGNDPDRARVS